MDPNRHEVPSNSSFHLPVLRTSPSAPLPLSYYCIRVYALLWRQTVLPYYSFLTYSWGAVS